MHRIAGLQLGLLLLVFSACSQELPPTLAPELVFYDWIGDMPQAVLDQFEETHGVHVNYVYYESQEEAIEQMRAGGVYDVVVMESRFIPLLAEENLLAPIDYSNLPNFKNISPNFRDLIYDPGNEYTIPYTWGTTGLVVRQDLTEGRVRRWADLWDPAYADQAAIWFGQPREVLGLTLKSLGYSANSEVPAEVNAAVDLLIEQLPNLRFVEDINLDSSAEALASGELVVAMGYARDVLLGQALNPQIEYVFPAEGALLWGDTFVLPQNSKHKATAELFLNYLLLPEISAQIANENQYATPNQAAFALIDEDVRMNPIIFPSDEIMLNAELILPLSQDGQQLYTQAWERFTAAKVAAEQ